MQGTRPLRKNRKMIYLELSNLHGVLVIIVSSCISVHLSAHTI